ncbi:MAG TPA: metal-dependent transcriptional regulator, partial [Methylomirabilota bacterium]|nr:metal-dependent transcriptional regulator [Methylomirabilota bacterium]
AAPGLGRRPGRGKDDVEETSLTPVLLECLDGISRLERDRSPASLAQVAKRLGLDKPLLMERVLGLQGRGLVQTDLSGRVRLTAEGQRVAVGLIRKHRLLERFLTDLLKLPWEQVHEEACRLTPVVSDTVADGLAELLGGPTTCPHGNPIPRADGALPEETGTPLHRLKPGQSGMILRIEREEPELLKYLATLGLFPQIKVEVDEVAPFGGPVLIRVGDSRYALGRKVAARIFVREA